MKAHDMLNSENRLEFLKLSKILERVRKFLLHVSLKGKEKEEGEKDVNFSDSVECLLLNLVDNHCGEECAFKSSRMLLKEAQKDYGSDWLLKIKNRLAAIGRVFAAMILEHEDMYEEKDTPSFSKENLDHLIFRFLQVSEDPDDLFFYLNLLNEDNSVPLPESEEQRPVDEEFVYMVSMEVARDYVVLDSEDTLEKSYHGIYKDIESAECAAKEAFCLEVFNATNLDNVNTISVQIKKAYLGCDSALTWKRLTLKDNPSFDGIFMADFVETKSLKKLKVFGKDGSFELNNNKHDDVLLAFQEAIGLLDDEEIRLNLK